MRLNFQNSRNYPSWKALTSPTYDYSDFLIFEVVFLTLDFLELEFDFLEFWTKTVEARFSSSRIFPCQSVKKTERSLYNK